VQLTLLRTSPRVAPGLLSGAAWTVLTTAGRRVASSADLPVARAVEATGHPVEVLAVEDLLPSLREDGRDVVWLLAPDELEVEWVVASVRGMPDLEVTVLEASYDVPGARVLDLVEVMDRLRAECPWDQEQTHRSLARYLLEETYETLEAIESGDPVHLREELGDLLLQVVFHARVASEDPGGTGSGFTLDDVAAGIVDKLVHRHPHVFAAVDVVDVDEVERNWEVLKAAEKGRASVLDGIPPALPALALADKVLGRAARVGVTPVGSDELGDRLLSLVLEARVVGADPEQELREAVRRLSAAVRAAER